SEFLRDIAAQPQALRDLVGYYRGEGAARLRQWVSLALPARRVLLSGMGSSEHALEVILPDLDDAGIAALAIDAGELLYYPRAACDLLVLVSQSGESVETRRVAQQLSARVPLVAVTNRPNSTIGRAASLVLPLNAGDEGLISTKTYTNTLGLLHLMGRALFGASTLAAALDALEDAAARMGGVDQAAVEQGADLMAGASNVHVVARGPALASAREFALILREGARLNATVFTGGAFRHGPFELVDHEHRAVLLAPEGPTRERMRSLAADLLRLGSRVVVVTDRPDLFPAHQCACTLPVSSVGETLFPVCVAPALELLVEALARRRGVRAGEFRYGGKVTTEE
ncbi:MAG: SIS domain-containing protein, partial [Armatimonadota bacterium]|nr:SIS domain-containing protein [Armatimonadota bacterium]